MRDDPSLLARFSDWLIELERRVSSLEVGVASPQSAGDDGCAPQAQVSEADIRTVYRLILDREADPQGLKHYLELTRSSDLGLADIASALGDSEECIARRAARIASVDLGGVKVAIDPDEPEFGRAITRDKVWEAHIVHRIKALLKPGDTFVDIGGNVGVMSFHAAQSVGPMGRVIAFEPNPDNVQRFLRGVLLNSFTNVDLYPVALSARSAVVSIRGGSNTCVTDASLGGRLVPAYRGDAMLRGESRVDMIKLDIEGHEPEALRGLAATLQRHRPLLLCEFNPRCLRAAGTEPLAFARQLFAMAERIEVIEHDQILRPIPDATALLHLWTERDASHVEKGDLPAGMVHFDLLIRLR